MKQKIYLLKCRKCGKEFETPTYALINLVAQQEVAPGMMMNQEVTIKMTPCPHCYYAAEVTPELETVEGEYEQHSTSDSKALRFIR